MDDAMTPEGYRLLKFVLETNPNTMGSTIDPIPKPHEDVQYLRISGSGLTRAVLMDVLDKAGLTPDSEQPSPHPRAPNLVPKLADGNFKDFTDVYLEDTNAPPQILGRIASL
jgi:hypothetical protein